MGKLDNKEVEAIANRLAGDSLNGRGKLDDLITKAAQAEGWNEEQIHRVTRKTNVATFEQMFKKLASGPDRIVDFDAVDSDDIIRRIHGATVSGEKVAAYYPALNDEIEEESERRAPRLPERAPNVKTAMAQAVPALDIESRKQHMRDVVAQLSTKHGQLRERWAFAMDKIAQASNNIYWRRADYEKNAMACYGAEILPELVALREIHGVKEKLPFEKEAAEHTFDNTLGHDDPLVEQLKAAAEIRQEVANHAKALGTAKDILAKLAKEQGT